MPIDPQDLSRRVLGWGLAAPLIDGGDVGRDLVLVKRPGSGLLDLGCVAGARNLGQDLAMALTTARGADPFDVGFGFDGLLALVEETEPAMIRERLRASVAKTVVADPRVRTVVAVEVTSNGSGNERVLGLQVTVDTIVGEQAVVAAPYSQV
jgi:hypothetical protein